MSKCTALVIGNMHDTYIVGIPDGPYVPARPGPPPEASDEQADYLSMRSECQGCLTISNSYISCNTKCCARRLTIVTSRIFKKYTTESHYGLMGISF